jgi:DnaJ-class molecular chaperone
MDGGTGTVSAGRITMVIPQYMESNCDDCGGRDHLGKMITEY